MNLISDQYQTIFGLLPRLNIMSLPLKKIPKVFISYSWTDPDHEDWVVALAQRLAQTGFNVVLDKWDLKLGQDKFSFMEQSVTSPEIDKVLIILDKKYVEKANSRSGGVGTEALIISPKIYDSVDQNKFIPVLRERDDLGNEYMPAFLHGRLYLDFSNNDKFEESFEQLIRELVNKPTHRRPERGILPKYLTEDEDDPIVYKISYLVRGIDAILSNKPKQLKSAIKEFLDEFYATLKNFKIVITDTSRLIVGKQIIDSLNAYKPVLDDFVVFFDKILKSGHDFDVDNIIEFFEKLTVLTKSPGYYTGDVYDLQVDNYRFIIHELFLSFLAVSLKNENYTLWGDLLHSKYLVTDEYGENKGTDYTVFYSRITSIDDYYAELNPDDHQIPAALLLISRLSDVITETHLVHTDLICHYISELFSIGNKNLTKATGWFPVLYLFKQKKPIDLFFRLSSKRFFEKVQGVFNVTTSEELKTVIQNYIETGPKHSNGYYRVYNTVPKLGTIVNVATIATEK